MASYFGFDEIEKGATTVSILLNGHQDQPILWSSNNLIASVYQTFEFSPDSPHHKGTLY